MNEMVMILWEEYDCLWEVVDDLVDLYFYDCVKVVLVKGDEEIILLMYVNWLFDGENLMCVY